MSTGSEGKESSEERQLRAQIEQTRAELGETVENLAAKADVRSRAQEKAAQTRAKAQARVAEVRTRVRSSDQDSSPGRATRVQERAGDFTHRAQDRAVAAGHQAQARLEQTHAPEHARDAARRVRAHTPERARSLAVPLAAAAAVALTAALWRRRAMRGC
ncbi:DUF3618 domain-containing protein [Streptomyces sp. NPDC059740]|uniref:DUF3618 domain-containing protein n=1 Tax=Streptomyces sp. NPDC059740 TaxID=3346926 RepID=UPI00365DC16B